ncbi:MAG: glycosyltransferase [bacterium]|nr:glycosyltransferase [bacterium]
MNIGIYFNTEKYVGGVYQYILTFLDCLRECDKYNYFVFYASEDFPVTKYHGNGWKLIDLNHEVYVKSNVTYYLNQICKFGIINPHKIILNRFLHKKFKEYEIDLMIYLTPAVDSFGTGIPYIMTIFDLQHRLQPNFLEVSADGIWEEREYLYKNATKHASAIIVDSEIGKEDVINFYQIPQERVKVLPYVSPTYILNGISEVDKRDIIRKFNLPEHFIFYPAQFWPHKNHINLVKALHLIKMKWGEVISAVFVGSRQERWGEFDRVMNLVRDLKMENEIKYLGFVSEKEMIALYSTAIALVMPTFFGPTNIPPLEAFSLGCPVITSNIRGIREQTGDAAVLVDPRNIEEIARAIYQVYIDIDLRKTLIENGYKIIKNWTQKDFSLKLGSIIDGCISELPNVDNIYQESISLPKEIANEKALWQVKFQVHIDLWNYYLSEGKDSQAEKSFKEALSITEIPEQVRFYVLVAFGNYYSIQKRYKEAEEKFNRALSVEGIPDSEKVFVHYDLGSMYERKGDYKKAKDKFETVIDLVKKWRWGMLFGDRKIFEGRTHFHLGIIYQGMGEKEKAAEEFKQCLNLIPDHRKARENLKVIQMDL